MKGNLCARKAYAVKIKKTIYRNVFAVRALPNNPSNRNVNLVSFFQKLFVMCILV